MPPSKPFTTSSSSFEPDALFSEWEADRKSLHQSNDFRSAIIKTFNLPVNDNYVYHAIASVTLSQVQAAINARDASGLHAWYLDETNSRLPPPPPTDITAYITLFNPSLSPSKSLTSFSSNAKKSSLRASIASHLLSHRILPLSYPTPRTKPPHANPSLDFWAWSCHELQWAGPNYSTERIKTSHHVLPVLMHHFGCVVPSWEALQIIKLVAQTSNGSLDGDGNKSNKSKGKEKQRKILDIGSGNGYWTYMLRRLGLSVTAVDDCSSTYRTSWISDTVAVDGATYLVRNSGAKDAVLLLVYPITGNGLTEKVCRAYSGDKIVIAGTQNGNGYTGFKDRKVEEFLCEGGGWKKTVQVPLPSFPGKDEGLFVFERG